MILLCTAVNYRFIPIDIREYLEVFFVGRTIAVKPDNWYSCTDIQLQNHLRHKRLHDKGFLLVIPRIS